IISSRLELEVALGERLRQGRHRAGTGVRIESHDLAPLSIVRARRNQRLADDLGCRSNDAGFLSNLRYNFPPVVESETGAEGKDPEVRIGNQNPLPEVVPQSIHHAQDHDQSHDADGDTADGNQGIQRQRARTAAPHVTAGDLPLQWVRPPEQTEQLDPSATSHYASGLMAGKGITSRIQGWSAMRILTRCTPIPT